MSLSLAAPLDTVQSHSQTLWSVQTSEVCLSLLHRKMLKDSAINDKVRRQRGYRTLDPWFSPTCVDGDLSRSSEDHLLNTHHIPGGKYRSYPGLLIPVYHVDGTVSAQYRPDEPTEGYPRYINPGNRTNVLDVHPANQGRIHDQGTELWITEGIKKADALTSQGICAVALSGVNCWRNKKGPLEDWKKINLQERNIIICFDADTRTNERNFHAMMALTCFLESEGAYVVCLAPPGEAKEGVDDYLASGGSIEQLRNHLVVENKKINNLTIDSINFHDQIVWSVSVRPRASRTTRFSLPVRTVSLETGLDLHRASDALERLLDQEILEKNMDSETYRLGDALFCNIWEREENTPGQVSVLETYSRAPEIPNPLRGSYLSPSHMLQNSASVDASAVYPFLTRAFARTSFQLYLFLLNEPLITIKEMGEKIHKSRNITAKHIKNLISLGLVLHDTKYFAQEKTDEELIQLLGDPVTKIKREKFIEQERKEFWKS